MWKNIPSGRQDHIVLLDQFPEIYQGIPHSSKSSVDAYIGLFCNVFEAHVVIMPHVQNLFLLFGKVFNKCPDILVYLFGDQLFFNRRIGKANGVHNVVVVVVIVNYRDPFRFPEMVDDQVMGYSHNPLDEFTLFFI